MKRQTGNNEQLDVTGGGSSGGTVEQGPGNISNPWYVLIDASQIPLPVLATIDTTGLATEDKQDDQIVQLASIITLLGSTLTIAGAVTVSNFPATQPVSGTITANLGTLNGAATEAKQDTEIASLASIKTNTDPLVTAGAGGYVRQDSTATIAKETGGNLATLTEPVDTKADLTRIGSPTTSLATSNTTPVTTNTTTDVVAAPSAGNHLEITRLHASNSSSTACKVSWKENGGSEVFQATLPQYGIVSLDLKSGWHLTTATKLQMVTSASASIDWTVSYRTIPD